VCFFQLGDQHIYLLLLCSGIRGAVLVFLPGELEITTMRKELKTGQVPHERWEILPLHSRLPFEECQYAQPLDL
jgi:HrpA-like RNA helicase